MGAAPAGAGRVNCNTLAVTAEVMIGGRGGNVTFMQALAHFCRVSILIEVACEGQAIKGGIENPTVHDWGRRLGPHAPLHFIFNVGFALLAGTAPM